MGHDIMSQKLLHRIPNSIVIIEEPIPPPAPAGNEEDRKEPRFMAYKEICSLCSGNGYITMEVEGRNETKQCWLCESTGEKEYSQAEVDDFIYKTYYKK